MNRRGFIQITSAALLPLLLGILPKTDPRRKYQIRVLSDRSFGHRLRNSMNASPSKIVETDVLIVGGGIAGVSAAMFLKDEDFLLAEAGETLGGTSGSDHWKSARFATGAHYELAYPKNFGKDVIDALTQMGIISWNAYTQMHEFNDKRFVIHPSDMEQCYRKGDVLEDVMDTDEGREEFEKILRTYYGEMPLPTRLISEEFHELNAVSFYDFLSNKMKVTKELKRRIDYQMLDDWGGTSDQVSALAGIHYYTCRPYNEKEVQLFSHPTGNKYFIEEMIGQLERPERILTNTLVSKIIPIENGVHVHLTDREGGCTAVRTKSVIYAGQKHVLKYIAPPELQEKIPTTEYAPWVVINFVCKKGIQFEKWQNDVLTDKMEFLGFVNSQKQHKTSKTHDVFTAYYCFESEQRNALVDLETHPEKIVDATVQLIEEETGSSFANAIEHVTVKLMGHAMPIPLPNYLSFEASKAIHPRIHLAGVDTGRLPLFYEACDSGIQAAKAVLNVLNLPNNGTAL